MLICKISYDRLKLGLNVLNGTGKIESYNYQTKKIRQSGEFSNQAQTIVEANCRIDVLPDVSLYVFGGRFF